MKILSVPQIREADAYTITHEPVSSTDLMERAAQASSIWLLKQFKRDHEFIFFCGNGNNGGDGLAIARLLAEHDVYSEVYIARVAQNDSEDFSKNLVRLQKQSRVRVFFLEEGNEEFFPVTGGRIVIDAIFGSGLSREPEGLSAAVIDHINKSGDTVVAIDIPSGLFGDDNLKNSYKHVVRANYTLTFQQPKLSFFFAENSPYAGQFVVLNIGLHPDFIQQAQTHYHISTKEEVRAFMHPRTRFSHKGTFGHALLVAGGLGKSGAAVLATRGCLRSGAGLVTVTAPKCSTVILQTAAPEAMVRESDGENFISGRIHAEKISAIGIGPGIGTEKQTEGAIKQLLQEFGGPMVIDADGLNILAENKTWMAFLPQGTILTPHPGEFDRLTEKFSTGYERMLAAREMAQRFAIYIVLKGAYTAIACPNGDVIFNSTGNPGMAKGGSGDALTGILTGLLAQGYSGRLACILGVYLHGLAGDIAAAAHAQEGMTANDIIENLGSAWRALSE